MLSRGDFTLVIPTYNRPALLYGLLHHLKATQASFPIIVLDSSVAESRSINQRTIASLPLRVQHAEFQHNTRVIDKLVSGLGMVKTRYVALCADDDLVFVDAIEDSLQELEEREDFVACHGIYLNCSPQGRTLSLQVEYSAPSIDGETPIERIFQHLSRYEALNYAVYRRECLVKAVGASTNVKSPMFWELFSGTVPLLSGKVKRLGRVSNVRRGRVAEMGLDWAPITWLCEDPDQFFAEFAHYRREFIKMVDVAHLSGFAKKFTQAHIPYVANQMNSPRHLRNELAMKVLPSSSSLSQPIAPPQPSLERRIVDWLLAFKPAPAIASFTIQQDDMVVSFPKSHLNCITPDTVVELSRYWASVLEMDPSGPA